MLVFDTRDFPWGQCEPSLLSQMTIPSEGHVMDFVIKRRDCWSWGHIDQLDQHFPIQDHNISLLSLMLTRSKRISIKQNKRLSSAQTLQKYRQRIILHIRIVCLQKWGILWGSFKHTETLSYYEKLGQSLASQLSLDCRARSQWLSGLYRWFFQLWQPLPTMRRCEDEIGFSELPISVPLFVIHLRVS